MSKKKEKKAEKEIEVVEQKIPQEIPIQSTPAETPRAVNHDAPKEIVLNEEELAAIKKEAEKEVEKEVSEKLRKEAIASAYKKLKKEAWEKKVGICEVDCWREVEINNKKYLGKVKVPHDIAMLIRETLSRSEREKSRQMIQNNKFSRTEMNKGGQVTSATGMKQVTELPNIGGR